MKANSSQSSTTQDFSNSQKISQIEEMLENTILLLGGMGAMGLLHKLIKLRQWIGKVKELWKNLWVRPGFRTYEKEEDKC